MTTRRNVLLVLLALGTAVPPLQAHVLDEYLQATLVVIEPGSIRLKINLTPGVEVADKILAQIDTNHDDAISESEAAAYAEVLKRDLAVRLDGQSVKLKLAASHVPQPEDLNDGHGIIRMEFAVEPASFAGGTHQFTLDNRHFAALGTYLFNAARPASTAIRIIKQDRNANQSQGQIEFAYDAPPRSSSAIGYAATIGAALVAIVMTIVVRQAIAQFRRVSTPRQVT